MDLKLFLDIGTEYFRKRQTNCILRLPKSNSFKNKCSTGMSYAM